MHYKWSLHSSNFSFDYIFLGCSADLFSCLCLPLHGVWWIINFWVQWTKVWTRPRPAAGTGLKYWAHEFWTLIALCWRCPERVICDPLSTSRLIVQVWLDRLSLLSRRLVWNTNESLAPWVQPLQPTAAEKTGRGWFPWIPTRGGGRRSSSPLVSPYLLFRIKQTCLNPLRPDLQLPLFINGLSEWKRRTKCGTARSQTKHLMQASFCEIALVTGSGLQNILP